MKRLIFHLLISAMTWGSLSARVVTDMAGRKVEVPDNLLRVAPYDFKTNLLLFPFTGGKMISRAFSLREAITTDSYRYSSKAWLKLRETDMRNAEEVMKLKPELLIVGSFINDGSSLETYEAFAKKVNIPLVVVDLEMMNLDKTFLFLGDLLDKQAEAKQCADFLQSVYADVNALTGAPARGKVYMANDPNGLRSTPNTSNHAQLFDIMKLENVVRTSLNAQGFAYVSIEQVMRWQPDYIFCVGKGDSNPYRTILKSAIWRTVPAVRLKQIYYVPCEPFLWFDMPPSVNRILGLIWFSSIFYNQSPALTKQKITDFYRIFYKYDLNDKEYNALFKWK
jgi:iron complex transport system substrate-binding protein